MKISTSSWHYRLLTRMHMLPGWFRDQTDLCTYMRRLTLALLLIGVAVFMVATYPYGWYLSFRHDHAFFGTVVMLLWALTNAILLAGSIILVFVLVARVTEKWRDRRNERPYQPGIVSAYWRSLKERACVIVTYGDK